MNKRRPRSMTVIRAIGWVTFLEIVRDKVLYNIILCAVLLFGIGLLASKLTFMHPERVLIDFGLSAVMISCCGIGVFAGAGLLGREIERRTIYVALSRPISRVQFMTGKFAGLAAVIIANWVLLVISYLAIVGFSSSGEVSPYSLTLMVALILALVASLLMASIAVFFSSFSTTSFSAIFSIGLYLVGNNVTQIQGLGSQATSSMTGFLLKGLALLLPNFENFSLGTRVTYGLPVSGTWVCFTIMYGFFMVALFLLLGGLLIQRREV